MGTSLAQAEDLTIACRSYLGGRRSDYAFRCIRFNAVANKLLELGLRPLDTIVDVGAGRQDFEKFMREEHAWGGKYLPIDGAIDGTDLNQWSPVVAYQKTRWRPDFFVAIEVLEHLVNPCRLMYEMREVCRKGVVVTTPNSESVDTLGQDPTHITALYDHTFTRSGWNCEKQCLFLNKPDDTLVAWAHSRQEG